MANSSSNSLISRIVNYFNPNVDYDSPLWVLRLSPVITLLCFVLAETAFKSGFAHGLCLGIAAGQITVLCLTAFQIKGITLRQTDDATFQQLHLTR